MNPLRQQLFRPADPRLPHHNVREIREAEVLIRANEAVCIVTCNLQPHNSRGGAEIRRQCNYCGAGYGSRIVVTGNIGGDGAAAQRGLLTGRRRDNPSPINHPNNCCPGLL